MTIEILLKRSSIGTWIDISGYVKNNVDFYFVKRNKDYSPVLHSMNLVLGNDWTIDMAYYDTTDERSVVVKVDGIVRFSGYVVGFSYIKESFTYNMEVATDLYKLQRLTVGTNLWSWASGGTPTARQYYNDGTYSYIQILRALWTIFYQVNLGLDFTDLEGVIWKSYDGVVYWDDITYDKLKLDLGMACCLNQPKSAYYADMLNNTPSANYNDNKLNGFEWLSMICSFLGLSISPISSQVFKLHKYQAPVNRNYSVPDDQVYAYDKKHYDGEVSNDDGWQIIYELGDEETDSGAIVPSIARAHYYVDDSSYTPRTVKETVNGNGVLSIDMIKHFMVIMELGNSTPPTHNVDNTIANYDAGRFIANSQYFPHYIESFNCKIDFSKPCVLENRFHFDKRGAYTEILQEDIYVTI